MGDPAIRVRGLRKVFETKKRKGILKSEARTVEALKGVDLDVEAGEFFGLLGPNGAGKTTLIKCLTTLLIPTAGEIRVNGYDPLKQEDLVRASIGCMLMGDRGLYWKLTGRENLDFFGALHFVPEGVRKKRIEDLIALLELAEFVDRQIESYSSGQKMITAFAKAIFHRAPVLIFDEPTVTMDVHASRKLRKVIKELNAEGHTILYTTHLMHEADELCERLAIIDRGAIIASGTPAELRGKVSGETTVRIEGAFPPGTIESARTLPGVKQAYLMAGGEGKGAEGEIKLICSDPRQGLAGAVQTIVKAGGTVRKVVSEEPTLEDVFVELTGRTLAEGEERKVEGPRRRGGMM